jgi:hypothetical protein
MVWETAKFTVSLLSMSATTVAAIAAWMSAKAAKESADAAEKNIEVAQGQLKEMKSQRRDSVRPDLYIHPSENEFEYDKDLGYARIKRDQLVLSITNIGIGPAKMVICEWKLDYKECFNIIEPFNENNRFYVLKKDHVGFNEASGAFYEEDFRPRTLPMIATEKERTIKFPFIYLRIVGIMKELAEEGKIQKTEIPEIELYISYYNIFNEKTKPPKSFLISPEMKVKTSHKNDDGEKGYKGVIRMEPQELVRGE